MDDEHNDCLWPDFDTNAVNEYLVELRKQASYLGKKTEGVITATITSPKLFKYDFGLSWDGRDKPHHLFSVIFNDGIMCDRSININGVIVTNMNQFRDELRTNFKLAGRLVQSIYPHAMAAQPRRRAT
jgi:hypothetical protein